MKKSDILEITQIKIKLSDSKEIELSSEEARKVYKELQTLFAAEKTDFEKLKEELKKIVPQTPVPYYPPIIIERYIKEPYWRLNEFYCSPTNPSLPFPDYTTCLSINLTNQT